MAPPASADLDSPRLTLVRVTVTGGANRVDVALPAAVPVVSMVSDLVDLLGVKAGEAHLVATSTGSVLDPSLGLRRQGIEDGAVLALAPVREHVPIAVHDDLVQAVHSLSRAEFTSWGPASVTVSSYVASAWLLALGALMLTAVGVLHPQDAMAAAVVSGVGTLGLLLAVARRTSTTPAPPQRDWRSVGAIWFACLYAALGGALLVTASPSGSMGAVATLGEGFGPVPFATLAALGAASVGCILLRRDRLLVAPVIGVGMTVLGGMLLEAAGLMAAQHWMVIIVTIWVLAARMAPGLAMDGTALRGDGDHRNAAGVDTHRLRRDLRVSHDMVLAISLTAVGLLLLAVPPALASGPLGLPWALTLTAVLALRLRRTRLLAHVGAGLGGVGLVTTCVVFCSAQLPAGLGIVLAGTLLGVGLVVAMTEGRVRSLRAGWLGDRAEILLTAASVPLSLFMVWPGLLLGG